MKVNLKAGAAAVALPALLIATPIVAANAGQIEGGNIYRVKNVTKNVDFTDPANADQCDVLQYRVRIHNPGPGALSNVNVKATLSNAVASSNVSNVTVSSVSADPESTSDTATVNLSSAQSESYVAGSTQLLDANGNVIKSLPDGITSGGVNIGDVGVSINEKRFVQFKAQVSCPTPVTPQTTPNQPAAAQTQALPQTGPEAGLAGIAGTGALGYAVMAYRRSKRALANSLRNQK